MELQQQKRILEETVKEILEKMGFKATVYTAIDATLTPSASETPISVEIQLEDSNYLIGKHGINLAAFQHICRIIIRKKSDNRINFTIDINNYRQEQKDSIIRLAKEMAQKAIDDHKAIVLRPMSPYERRLIHIELAKIEGVTTESVGEGDERKVIIKPSSL